jgi:dihydroorotate dehydrogenase electron transfer subunit
MIITEAKVIENIKLAKNIWKMVFFSQEIADDYIGAGQFLSILPNDNWEHPIRRPMSIAGVNDCNITIIYKLFGSVTKALSNLKAN